MNYIKEFWDNQAKSFKGSPEASWGDSYAVALEVQNIGRYISEGDSVLDVGCANGHATVSQLERNPRFIVGVDYSEEMIKQAEERNRHILIQFRVADILALPFPNDSFDVVYTTRCLINLPTWEQQLKGIQECIRVAKKRVVFSEGFYEPLVKLNCLRNIFGLSPLVEHDFNRYLKKERLESWLYENKYLFECNDFSSLYYIGSRVLREVFTDYKTFEGYGNPINELFFDLQKVHSGGGVGIQQIYMITK